jgi:uncharacterized repeat protein (TIGR01451 family)
MGLTIGIGIGGRIGTGGDPSPAATTMTVSIADSPDPVNASSDITYTIQVTVTGPADAVNVTTTFTLDAALTFVSHAGTGWTLARNGQVVTATANALVTGAAPAITVVATAPAENDTVTSGVVLTASNATQQTDSEDTTVTASIVGVTRDATNLNYYPADDTEWTALMTAASLATGNPGNVWALQGAGNAADTGTPGGCTLTNSFGAPQSAVTGATRLGYTNTDGGVDKKLVGTTGAPNPRSTSTLVLAYVDYGAAPGGTRDFMGVQIGSLINYLANGKLRIVAGANTDSASAYNTTQGWVAVRTDITASTITLFTHLEKLPGTYVLPNNGSAIWLGGHTALSSAAVYAYCAEFNGTAAELSDAQVKTLLQTLGASIPWS